MNLLIILFLITSAVGLWAAYDTELAFQRFYLIIGATFLYFSLANQPKENFWLISIGLGLLGTFTTIIFLLIQDWSTSPADIDIVNQVGQRWAEIRPSVNTETLLDFRLFHANIVGGINAVLLPFCIVTTIFFWKKGRKFLAIFCFGIVQFLGLGFAVTSSRAAWAATFLGLILLAALSQSKIRWFLKSNKYLLIVVPLFIILFGVIAPLIFANVVTDTAISITEVKSLNSRLRIARDTFFLIADYPFTGGGLGSFPGQYSQYILVIPHFMFSYSHNLYLDVIFEQGILGFIVWVCIILFCSGMLSSAINDNQKSNQYLLFANATYASLSIFLLHGISDDAIYSNAWGLPLLFLFPGLSIALSGQKKQILRNSQNLGRAGLVILVLLSVSYILYHKQIQANWYANIGAVKMSKVDLENWPTGEWNENYYPSVYNTAEKYFSKAINYQKKNQTANYRLGLLKMSRLEFQEAVGYLETSYQTTPQHRGTQKSLGYCYTWLGNFDDSETLLLQIPEAQTEMEVYAGWWQKRGRSDLAENASIMAERLD